MGNLNRREIMRGAGAAVAGAAMAPASMAFPASSRHYARCITAAIAIRNQHDMAFTFREVIADGRKKSNPRNFIDLGDIERLGEEPPNQIVKKPQVEDYFVAIAQLDLYVTGAMMISEKVGVPMRDGSRLFLDQGTAVVVDRRDDPRVPRLVGLYMNPGEDPVDSVWLFGEGVRIMEDALFSTEPHGETGQVFSPRA